MTNTAPRTPGEGDISVESLLNALTDIRRRRAALDAKETAILSAAVAYARTQDQEPSPSEARGIPLRSIAAQIGAALRVSDRTVQRHLSEATLLAGRFEATLVALATGEISRGHVTVIMEAGLSIEDDEVRAAYEAAALEVARREAPGRLRPAAKMLAARMHPIPLETRHAQAATVRDVWVRDLDDGMAELIATLPAVIAHGIRDRLDRFARREIDARRDPTTDPTETLVDNTVTPDTRRIGEIRTDTFADLLLTGHATPEISNDSTPEGDAIVAQVQLTVPVLTVLGADTTPAELVGHAPVDAATALRLAGAAPGGTGCSPTRSPAPSSPWTATDLPTTSNESCGCGTSTVGSPDAGCPPGGAMLITPPRENTTDPPHSRTARLCAGGTTPSNTTPHGGSGKPPTEYSTGPARRGGCTPTGRHER